MADMGVRGFLKQVVEIKLRQVESAKSYISLTTMRQEAEERPIRASFLTAVKKSSAKDIGIIAEIKKASPSKGDIAPDLDPASLSRSFTKAGAIAVSVLTETEFFKGSLKDLEIVCEHTDLPVLRKDFIIDEYQIYEAKRAYASSVLLITAILDKDQLRDYLLLARELGLEPLVEITSEKEFETAYYAGAKVVDVNHRNLETLETDLTISQRISAILPQDIIPVAASGITSFKDIETGISHRFYNFLVGESIVRAKDPITFIKMLRNINE